MIASILCLLACVLRVAAQAYDYGVDVVAMTRRADSSTPVVVGKLPLSPNGTVPVRLEIRSMRSDRYKWDLYVLALSMFQYVGQDDPTSWYQIAGIHGVPFDTWNGVGPAEGAEESGYCTHSSVLFPTWHRPYIALYEQEMYRIVNSIADLFTNPSEKQLYKQAAQEFRIPYWDWAASPPGNEPHFPDVFWNPVISQYGPKGIQYIKNPLYSYEFAPLHEDEMIWAPLKFWHETKRAPDLNVSNTSPPSNNTMINEKLKAKLPEIQQRLYILFANYKTWNSFSNKAWAEERNTSWLDSIEAVHDIIHIYGGYYGHMTYVPLSSFDPLFFLHHAMTDRLVAMWQALNPSSWILPMPSGETSYNSVRGSIQDSESPLTPFFVNLQGDFWDSDMARTTEAFGYAYEDTRAPLARQLSMPKDVSRKVSKWFGDHSPLSLKASPEGSRLRLPRVEESWRSLGDDKIFRPNVRIGAPSPPQQAVVEDGGYTEWIINVKVNVEALDGRFDLHFFIGCVPKEVKEWDDATNHLGTVGIFAMDRMTGSQSTICGTLPFTTALTKMVAASHISSLKPATVLPLLEDMLQFRVVGSDRTEVKPKLVDGLSIVVMSSEVTRSDSDEQLPHYAPAETRLQMWP